MKFELTREKHDIERIAYLQDLHFDSFNFFLFQALKANKINNFSFHQNWKATLKIKLINWLATVVN